MTEIAERVAVVTGGGSGIGMGMAKELARQGASVAVADIITANAEKVAAEINAKGGEAISVVVEARYDAATAWEEVNGLPTANSSGAVLARSGAATGRSYGPFVR